MKLSIPTVDVDDDRAVSPVIGVILMVAITVILAAVIGAFVLNLGQSVGETAPRASIGVDDAGDAYNVSDGDNTAIAYINHNTGEDIKYNNLKIVVQSESGAKVATFSASNWNSSNMTIVSGNSGVPDSTGSFQTGDQLVLQHTDGKDAEPPLDSGTTYTFQFIHTKSGQTITTATVTIQ